jgi:hypothetical protein
MGAWRLATRSRPKQPRGRSLAARPSWENGPRGPRQSRARRCGLRAWDITVARSSVTRRRQGVAGDLEGDIGEVPGKEEGAEAHRSGVLMVRRREWRRVAAFNGGGVAPVVVNKRGEVLQLEGDQWG